MKAVLIVLIVLLIGSLLTETVLRLMFGFGNPPLYMADDAIGYLFLPNQQMRRFGNLISINQYSMRTRNIDAIRPAETLRVFLIGDSIVNGNWWTDQSEILSVLIEKELTQTLQQPVEVLNASANSWGPRNELAYLKKFGTFESQIVLLVINTDDLFGVQPNTLQVGKDRSYPDKKPVLALLEIATKLKKQPPIPGLSEIQAEKGDRVGKNLQAIQAIKHHVDASNGQLLMAMTPLKREVLDNPRDYELVARKRVDDLIEQQQIRYIDFLQSFQNSPGSEKLYRDHIHLSPVGNQLVTRSLVDLILQSLAAQDDLSHDSSSR